MRESENRVRRERERERKIKGQLGKENKEKE